MEGGGWRGERREGDGGRGNIGLVEQKGREEEGYAIVEDFRETVYGEGV